MYAIRSYYASGTISTDIFGSLTILPYSDITATMTTYQELPFGSKDLGGSITLVSGPVQHGITAGGK